MIVAEKQVSKVNGPGKRAVTWNFGCSLSCRGCWNSYLWSHDERDNTTPQEVAEWILAQPGIEGWTMSGGEPMEAAADNYEIMKILKRENPALSIGAFTGYTLQELESGRFKYRGKYVYPLGPGTRPVISFEDNVLNTSVLWASIREMLDFAVMGRFQESKKTQDSAMISSTNQKLELFSNRYTAADFIKQQVEIKIKPGGLTTITGFPIGVPGL